MQSSKGGSAGEATLCKRAPLDEGLSCHCAINHFQVQIVGRRGYIAI